MTPDPTAIVLIVLTIITGTYFGEKQDNWQEYFAFGGKTVDEIERILRANRGKWMSLENIHKIRSWRFFGENEMEMYLEITRRDCEALVRDGVLKKLVEKKGEVLHLSFRITTRLEHIRQSRFSKPKPTF